MVIIQTIIMTIFGKGGRRRENSSFHKTIFVAEGLTLDGGERDILSNI